MGASSNLEEASLGPSRTGRSIRGDGEGHSYYAIEGNSRFVSSDNYFHVTSTGTRTMGWC